MWSRSRRLGLETVSRRTNVSSRSRLGQNPQRLGLVSALEQHISVSAGGFRLGSRAIASRRDVLCRHAPCITIAAVRAILTSMTFVA